MKQRWGLSAQVDFVATANTRNELMLREAGEFAGHLKRCEKDIRAVKVATEGTRSLSSILVCCRVLLENSKERSELHLLSGHMENSSTPGDLQTHIKQHQRCPQS